VSAGDAVGAVAATAVGDALAASRPVYLEVPTDLLSADAAPGDATRNTGVRPLYCGEVDSAVALLEGAERPVIWAGGGALGIADEVDALARVLGAPVLTTFGAAGLLAPDHPCRVGMPPHVEAAGRLWDEADVVIAVGSDLDGTDTQNWAQPQPPHLIAINVDREDATKNYRADAVLPELGPLLERLAPRGEPEMVARRIAAVRAEACQQLDADALRFLDAVCFAVPDDAVLVCDMCIPGYWIAGFHTFAHPRRLQYPIGWGTLGFAFPAGLGAALAGTGPAVVICGDGGFLFACGELATVAQERIPLTTVIVDDGGYGMLRYDQELAGHEPYGVDLHTPDFAALATAFGVRAETVESLGDEFGEALARHVADPEPSVLVARAPALVPPPTTSPRWYRKG